MYAVLKNDRLESMPVTKESLTEELREINGRIAAVNREFNLVTDEKLIDGLIYEMLSLTERQGYLIKTLKKIIAESENESLSHFEAVDELPSGA
ncbi:MAG: hypothetical protein Q8865_03485 [Bacillota bacterium]|nr:hypothetical protein [Bacillota bacterium]